MTTLKHLIAMVTGYTPHNHCVKFHNGAVSCDCAQWKFRGRKCVHLDIFRKHFTDDAAKMMSIGDKVAVIEAGRGPVIATKAEILETYPELFKFKVRVHGTGRATCKICDKLIDVGQAQVTAIGRAENGSVHLECLVKLSRGIRIKPEDRDADEEE